MPHECRNRPPCDNAPFTVVLLRIITSLYNFFLLRFHHFGEKERTEKFSAFLKNEYKRKADIVKSTYSNFTAAKPTTAKKPGQKKRVKASKTCKKYGS